MIKKILLILSALYFVLLMRLVKPFIVVRIYPLDVGRIGGMVVVYYYLSMKTDSKYYDVFYFTSSTGSIANKSWVEIAKRHIRTIDDMVLGNYISKLNKKLSRWEDHIIPILDPCPTYEGANAK